MLGEAIQHDNMTGTLLDCAEAVQFVEQIPDMVPRNLVNMAFVHLVKKAGAWFDDM